MPNEVELLAPAGSMDALKAALARANEIVEEAHCEATRIAKITYAPGPSLIEAPEEGAEQPQAAVAAEEGEEQEKAPQTQETVAEGEKDGEE